MKARLQTLRRCAMVAAIGLTLSSCTQLTGVKNSTKSGKLEVVATASVLSSIVESIGAPYVHVETLVPNGASAETFEPTPRELTLLHDAKVLVENGAGYETWIGKLLVGANNLDIRTVVLSLGVKKSHDNPHLWMDPVRARIYAHRIRNVLSAADPAHRAEYRHNDQIFEQSLRRLQRRIARAIKTIPHNRRGMIVTHDAWRYYNERFGLLTYGVIETAPGREPAASHLEMIVRLARARHVAAIFSEAGENPRLAQTVVDEVPGAKVVTLHVDSFDDTALKTDYRDLLWDDTQKIVAALKSAPPSATKVRHTVPSADSDDTSELESSGSTEAKPAPVATSGAAASDPDEGDLK